jgi:hypothetical protein
MRALVSKPQDPYVERAGFLLDRRVAGKAVLTADVA